MDHDRFDGLTRAVGAAVTRRTIGGVLTASGLGALAAAGERFAVGARKRRRKKKRKGKCQPNCSDRTCGKNGCGGSCGTCGGDEVCHGGACCQPEPRGATCAGRCGTWTNNCGQAVECATCAGRCGTWTNNCGQGVECATCADGQVCLSNGSCAIACSANEECGSCGCSNPSIEGEHHCIAGLVQPLVNCASTDDCPPGSHCQDIGAGGICIELCT